MNYIKLYFIEMGGLAEILCCCLSDLTDISFNIRKSNNSNGYDIILFKQINTVGFVEETEKIIFENVENKEENITFLHIINKILKNINKISQEGIAISFNEILDEFLKEDEISLYLSKINSLNEDIKSIEGIEGFISLMKRIYRMRNEIRKESIIYIIKSLYLTLKKTKILTKDELKFLYKKLEKIFLEKEDREDKEDLKEDKKDSKEDKKDLTEDISHDEKMMNYTNIGTRIGMSEGCEQKNFNDFSMNSSINVSFYSKSSQNQIKKMNEEIKELKSEIEKSHIFENKQFVTINFLDKAINKKLPVNLFLHERDKFSTVIEKFYEKYPDFEEKEIKKFTINGEKIKRNQYIGNINVFTLSSICIDY